MRLGPVGLVMTLAVSAHAQAPSSASVLLIYSGDAADLPGLEAPTREVLGRLGVELTVRSAPADVSPDESWLAVVRADWSGTEECVVALTDSQDRVSIRRRLARAQGMPVIDEAAAHVIQSAVDELVNPARRRVSAPPLVTTPRLETPLVATPVRLTGPGLDVAGFFGAHAFGSPAPVAFSGGLLASFTFRTERWRPTAWLLGEYHPGFDVSGDLVTLRAQIVSLRVGGSIDLVSLQRFRLDLGLGAGADVFGSVATSTELPAGRLARPRVDADPVLATRLTAHFGIARTADVFVALSGDVDLRPLRFVSDPGPGREVIYRAWPVRPAVVIGFSFSALGPAPYGDAK